MNRRHFLKTLAATAAGVTAAVTGAGVPVTVAGTGVTAAVVAPSVGKEPVDYKPHFWLLECYVFGHSFIDNIRYETVHGIRAAECNLGDRLLTPDGSQYVCAGHYENPQTKTS
jgi:hypothetical protein